MPPEPAGADGGLTDGLDEPALLATILATSPVGLGFLDPELRFVRVNEALARGNGVSPEGHLGRRIDEVWRDIPPDLLERLRGLVRTGEAVRDYEVRTESRNGDRYVLGSYYPVWGDGRRVSGVGIVVVDISARKHAEDELRFLAREQAALRHVATLVASEENERRLFACVTEEVGRLLGAQTSNLVRFEGAETIVVLGGWAEGGARSMPIGMSFRLEAETAVVKVRRTGRPARLDDYAGIRGELAERLRRLGIRSSVAAPVKVAGRLWGALTASSTTEEPLAAGAEEQLADFADLVAQALANADARRELEASRTRIVEAGYAERRRLERDLHDGAQQRLVALSLALRLAEAKLAEEPAQARALLAAANDELSQALAELRELARGIHPAVLTERGLRPALVSLAERVPVPVDLAEVTAERLPGPVEAAVYFVVAEALTNVAKYADASEVLVRVRRSGGHAQVEVVDDGVGGARGHPGSGLRGLGDRVEALGGRLEVVSPPAGGTRVSAEIPLAAARDADEGA